MSKFIIINKSDLKDEVALRFVSEVVAKGRMSNNGKQYCYATSFYTNESLYFIESGLNEKSDRFTVFKA